MPRYIKDVRRRWILRTTPTKAQLVFRVAELAQAILSNLDIVTLLKYRQIDVTASAEAGEEVARRFNLLVLGLVPAMCKDDLIDLLRQHEAGFGGFEALKVLLPTCEDGREPRTRRVYTLFTPRGQAQPFHDFFHMLGFKRTHIDGDTMEMKAAFYFNAAHSCTNFRAPYRCVFVDVVESTSHLACYPIFRMFTTYLMHFVTPDKVFAPYARLTCQNQGVLNHCHASDDFGVGLPLEIHDYIQLLRVSCGVELHANPTSLRNNGHRSRCGMHTNCVNTVRSTALPGSLIYSFRRAVIEDPSFPEFFHTDGLVWRLGGWACYPGFQGTRSYLAEAPELHKSHEGQELAENRGLGRNAIVREVMGWI